MTQLETAFSQVKRRRAAVIPAVVSTQQVYQPEDNPFETVMVDVTHRCNMTCRNCYIPNRNVPDLDSEWLIGILRRFPKRTRIRLVGAEPTVRKDLPDLVARVRGAGHLPIVMSNGLKLTELTYVRELKSAGLRTVYLSMNGGLDDDLYWELDEMRCADRKIQALDNLCAEKFYVSVGTIIARDVNERCIKPLFERLQSYRQVYEFHLRSIGAIGRYMDSRPYRLDDLRQLFQQTTGVVLANLPVREQGESYVDIMVGRLKLQLTQWPDLGSKRRGRLSPDGTVQPSFEHIMANQGGY